VLNKDLGQPHVPRYRKSICEICSLKWFVLNIKLHQGYLFFLKIDILVFFTGLLNIWAISCQKGKYKYIREAE
jgi:hypothetical protein